MKKHEQILLYITLILTIAYVAFGFGRFIGNKEVAEFVRNVCDR